MPTKQTDKAKIYIPENDKEREALERLVEKGIVDYYGGGYYITDEAFEFIIREFCREKNLKRVEQNYVRK